MPASQLFKEPMPIELLFQLLDKISVKYDDHYEVCNLSFKKGMYSKSIPEFIEQCKPYYHNSKQKYLERSITYSSFITIIRQICKASSLKYKTNIRYDKTHYCIVYHIYILEHLI